MDAALVVWLPTEIWTYILTEFVSIRDVARFTRACRYFNWLGSSDLVWSSIFRRTLNTGVYKKRTRKPIAHVPVRVVRQGISLPARTRYLRLLHWFYDTEIRQRGNQYPLSLTIHRPRKLKLLEGTGAIPKSWCRRREDRGPSLPPRVYRRRVVYSAASGESASALSST